MSGNKTNLVIVESPAKAKTIGKYLGSDYKVTASMGHLRDLPKSTMGVDIDNGFIPEYVPVKGREDTINELRKAAKASGKVYLATDPDREGEAISWHLKELLGLGDDALRVTFNEITKKVVQDSINNPREIDQNLVGGVSLLSGYVSKVRHEEENVLYAIAGDMFRGSIIDSEFHGISTIQIMNMLAPDIVTVGNHEVDYGVAHLLFLEKCAEFLLGA